MNVIEIKDLKKHFAATPKNPPVKALDGVSFEVKEGEVFGFLGPNGAGKTTAIRCLMDFIRPSAGSITIFGKDSRKDSVFLKSQIGYLPGNVKLHANWTGHEHVTFVESIRGKSKDALDIAKKLDLDLTKRFKNLSSGNKQKLGIVLALMSEPKLLVMDEPTVGLDPLLQNTIYQLLDELKKKGTTIFFSSHNLPEVERVCDRVGIIKEGRMVAVETLKEMEGKRIHQVEVRFVKPIKASDLKLSGVENMQNLPDGFIFDVAGDINPILKELGKHELSDITITHAALEEVFLKFYEKK